jgi:hypothetical protein
MGRKHSFPVRLKHSQSVLRVKFFSASGSRMATHYLLRRHKVFSEQPGNDRLRHHAATYESHGSVTERIHGSGWLGGLLRHVIQHCRAASGLIYLVLEKRG